MTGQFDADADHPKAERTPGTFVPWHAFDACFRNLICLLCFLCLLCIAAAQLFFPD